MIKCVNSKRVALDGSFCPRADIKGWRCYSLFKVGGVLEVTDRHPAAK